MLFNEFHWVWYLLGFLCCPKLTIMIALSIYLKQFIPLPLMILGWMAVFCAHVNIRSTNE